MLDFSADVYAFGDKMREKFLELAKREYPPKTRLIALIVEGGFFMGVLPVALVYLSSLLDTHLGLPLLEKEQIAVLVGVFLVVAGFSFAVWAIYVQFTIGRGTPAPFMATQNLIVQKPYSYCRNPMALGTITLYLGTALIKESISAVGLVAVGAIALLTYIKMIEEKEMEMRFGDSYRTYKEQTPFLIPRLRKRKKG